MCWLFPLKRESDTFPADGLISHAISTAPALALASEFTHTHVSGIGPALTQRAPTHPLHEWRRWGVAVKSVDCGATSDTATAAYLRRWGGGGQQRRHQLCCPSETAPAHHPAVLAAKNAG